MPRVDVDLEVMEPNSVAVFKSEMPSWGIHKLDTSKFAVLALVPFYKVGSVRILVHCEKEPPEPAASVDFAFASISKVC